MRKLGKITAFLGLCMMFTAGCGDVKAPDSIDVTSAAVGRKGEVRLWQVGEFGREDYVLEELRSMAVEEAARFNLAVQVDDAVAVEKVEMVSGSSKVVVEYRFDSWKSCTDFVEETLFFGTLKEARLNGYDIGPVTKLESVKDGSLSGEGMLEELNRSVVITDLKANVYCSGTVTYISGGAVVNEDGSIGTFGAEGMVYILLK